MTLNLILNESWACLNTSQILKGTSSILGERESSKANAETAAGRSAEGQGCVRPNQVPDDALLSALDHEGQVHKVHQHEGQVTVIKSSSMLANENQVKWFLHLFDGVTGVASSRDEEDEEGQEGDDHGRWGDPGQEAAPPCRALLDVPDHVDHEQDDEDDGRDRPSDPNAVIHGAQCYKKW